ncbi:unnamed protein product [Paramecium sonneborni]|uniref:ELMO domain-containing protein n=1 Tax=Paramecium sonneborni TaxID=65129 RepID=A0A8S1NIN4_9CILI|nr:unnamed protein product [Paramecium sonneborni]
MNQEMKQKDQTIILIHQPKNHPWTEIQMAHEPTTHAKNKEFKEKYLSSCFDETYDLSNQEIKEWWELRVELYPLYSHEDENCVKRIKGLWYLLTDSDLEQIRNQKWTEFGFQQADPTTDFRGGGVQSLDDIINFVSDHKETKVKEMCKPQNDFYFAASSINITFFIKRFFHLQEQLDERDRKEIADRVALKNFCRSLVREDNLWKKLHQLLLSDLFNEWMALKNRRPETTIMDYGPILERVKQKTKRTFQTRLFSNLKQLIEFYQSL